MAGIKDAVNNLKTVEGTLANNKVANFCYTDTAYTNNQANGVSDYDYEREQNIPVASTEVLKTNETVFLKGFRSQASSITRMLLNHFFGRVSYNLNKTADVLNGLLTNLYSYLGTANGIATLDANGRVPASQLPETAMEFKGTWNCATNTTSTSINLINGQGTKGDLYLCSVEGWFNASTGTGSATKPSPDTGYVQYFVNDRIVYDGSTWNRLSSGDIQRVNGLSPSDGNVQITRRVTQAQYNALTSAEKEGHIFIITDVNMNDLYVINDAVTASDSVWSSQKTSNALAEKVNTNAYNDTNLNTLINIGFYVVTFNNQTWDNLNFPVNYWGNLLVGNTGGNLTQMFMSDIGQLVYVRNYSANVWSSWKKVLTASDITDTVASGNMHSVTSNAVYNSLGGTLKLFKKLTKTINSYGSWEDIVICGYDIEEANQGLYAVRVVLNDNTTWFNENLSTVIFLFCGVTNSDNASPVYFNQCGHANNAGQVQLRMLRHLSTATPLNFCNLQININTGNSEGVVVDVYLYRIS